MESTTGVRLVARKGRRHLVTVSPHGSFSGDLQLHDGSLDLLHVTTGSDECMGGPKNGNLMSLVETRSQIQ